MLTVRKQRLGKQKRRCAPSQPPSAAGGRAGGAGGAGVGEDDHSSVAGDETSLRSASKKPKQVDDEQVCLPTQPTASSNSQALLHDALNAQASHELDSSSRNDNENSRGGMLLLLAFFKARGLYRLCFMLLLYVFCQSSLCSECCLFLEASGTLLVMCVQAPHLLQQGMMQGMTQGTLCYWRQLHQDCAVPSKGASAPSWTSVVMIASHGTL